MKNSGTSLLILLFAISIIIIHVKGQNDTSRQLQFLVPRRELDDFVKVSDLGNGSYGFGGFSIEVFKAAAKMIRPSIDYKLVPFINPEGSMKGSFDDMLQAVQNDVNVDGAVGETTILSRRMQWVDFTSSYLDTEIGILVRKQGNENRESVALLTPGTKVILVLVGILGFSILVAVVLWISKLCKYSHASFSTQLSVQVIILVLMVILLTISSYVPRQTSSLPAQRSNSDVKSLVDLKRKGLKVGYRQGAFVKFMLVNKGGILESNLRELDSEVEMLDKLQKGGSGGGIDALVAGTHHLKLFQEKHCSNFTLVQDFSLKSAGLGFAFKQDHPLSLAKKFSEAIVTLIDNGDMEEIQAMTIGDLDKICQDNNETSGSTVQDRISLWLPVASAIFVVVLVLVMLLSYCGTMYMKE